jgi:hypothetical protein
MAVHEAWEKNKGSYLERLTIQKISFSAAGFAKNWKVCKFLSEKLCVLLFFLASDKSLHKSSSQIFRSSKNFIIYILFCKRLN